ncbi:aldo/keto reductase [Micromonospora sp. NPDC049102]|uniref:aldo/keto reductase n=1 Tax=Micromonospora sp. NPDC049102 TaxID=3364265 RepID=UPI003723D7C4
MVDQRPFGRTGVRISSLTLGAMNFGQRGNPDHEDGIRIIHRALDEGINAIDTADVYSNGESEEIVGKAVAGGRRDDVFLATKFHGQVGDNPQHRGNSRRWIVRSVENSLRRLGTDWIDLYQAHRPEPDTDFDETLPANAATLTAVDELATLADEGGLSLIHLAIAFVLEHPAVTSAIIGPRTLAHLESQLGAAKVTLSEDVLDRIDAIVPPGTTLNPADAGYQPPSLTDPAGRRRGGSPPRVAGPAR